MPSHLCGFLFPSVSFSSKYSIYQVSPSCAFWDADTEGTVIKRLGAKGQTPALTSSIKQRLYAGSTLKNKQKQTNKQQNYTSILCLSCLSIISSFLLVSLEASVYHAMYHFTLSFTCKCSLYNVLMISLKASVFWYIINTGPSLNPLLSILQFS